MEKKNTLLLTVIAVATLLVAVVGATFAYFGSFSVDTNNKVAVNTTTEAASSSTFISKSGTVEMNVPSNMMVKGAGSNLEQAATATGNLEVELTSAQGATTTTTCTYDVYYHNTGSTYYGVDPTEQVVPGEFTYTLTSSQMTVDPAHTGAKDYIAFNASQTTPVKVASGSISAKGTASQNTVATDTLNITLKFYNMPNTDQSRLADKSFTGEFYVDNVVCSSANS